MQTASAPFPFPGRLTIVGWGAIAQGVLPLLLRHFALRPERIAIVTADAAGVQEALDYGISHTILPLTRDNYRHALAPFSSATVLQVTAGVMAGMAWAIEHPAMGVVDPDELPYDELIALCRPYLGEVVGVYTDWTPLKNRADFFPQDIDAEDPWQFRNFRVN